MEFNIRRTQILVFERVKEIVKKCIATPAVRIYALESRKLTVINIRKSIIKYEVIKSYVTDGGIQGNSY